MDTIRRRLVDLLRKDASFFLTAIVFSIAISLLSLAVPLIVQALVNSVSFVIVKWPIGILSLILFGVLLITGFFSLIQSVVIEKFQQHYFCRMAGTIGIKLLNLDLGKSSQLNVIEKVNRYFDVMTVQKAMVTLFTSGFANVLQFISGLLLLAIYHPYFIVFNFVMIIAVFIILRLFLQPSLETAMKESKAKYQTVRWFEEIARIPRFFEEGSSREKGFKHTDMLIGEYVKARQKHFKFLFGQNFSFIFLYALLSSTVLGLGGYLVTIGQLSLGQLVASELIVTIMLVSMSKSGKYLEIFYDLAAALEKLAELEELPEKAPVSLDKREEALNLIKNFESLELEQLLVKRDEKNPNLQLDLVLRKGAISLVYSPYSSSQQMLLNVLSGNLEYNGGRIKYNDNTVNHFDDGFLQEFLCVYDSIEVLEGSIRENLAYGSDRISDNEILNILEIVDLASTQEQFTNGLDTQLNFAGEPFWPGQLWRFQLARKLLHLKENQILILTSTFDNIDELRRRKVIDYLRKKKATVLYISGDRTNLDVENAKKFNSIFWMDRTQLSLIDAQKGNK